MPLLDGLKEWYQQRKTEILAKVGQTAWDRAKERCKKCTYGSGRKRCSGMPINSDRTLCGSFREREERSGGC